MKRHFFVMAKDVMFEENMQLKNYWPKPILKKITATPERNGFKPFTSHVGLQFQQTNSLSPETIPAKFSKVNYPK